MIRQPPKSRRIVCPRIVMTLRDNHASSRNRSERRNWLDYTERNSVTGKDYERHSTYSSSNQLVLVGVGPAAAGKTTTHRVAAARRSVRLRTAAGRRLDLVRRTPTPGTQPSHATHPTAAARPVYRASLRGTHVAGGSTRHDIAFPFPGAGQYRPLRQLGEDTTLGRRFTTRFNPPL